MAGKTNALQKPVQLSGALEDVIGTLLQALRDKSDRAVDVAELLVTGLLDLTDRFPIALGSGDVSLRALLDRFL